LVPKPGF